MIDYKITRELFPILILFVGGINVAMDLQFFVDMCQSEKNTTSTTNASTSTLYNVYVGHVCLNILAYTIKQRNGHCYQLCIN